MGEKRTVQGTRVGVVSACERRVHSRSLREGHSLRWEVFSMFSLPQSRWYSSSSPSPPYSPSSFYLPYPLPLLYAIPLCPSTSPSFLPSPFPLLLTTPAPSYLIIVLLLSFRLGMFVCSARSSYHASNGSKVREHSQRTRK